MNEVTPSSHTSGSWLEAGLLLIMYIVPLSMIQMLNIDQLGINLDFKFDIVEFFLAQGIVEVMQNHFLMI